MVDVAEAHVGAGRKVSARNLLCRAKANPLYSYIQAIENVSIIKLFDYI